MPFTATVSVLAALQAKLEALEWTPATGPAEPAFQKVALFDVDDLATAIKDLLVFKDRACFILLDAERCDSELAGNKVVSRLTRTVALLITDRDYGKRADALVGDATRPGVLALKDLILDPDNEIIGDLVTGVAVLPGFGSPVRITGEARDNLTGRLAYELDLELKGGSLVVALTGPGPIV